ncbi:MAG: prepilin-type N-terminal cleavage/methylation domain-containing protein [Phycisphaerae bacterium]|nr:prepilin-type N-terminal cleavage/methylation domain-containing protein [Phycisphaerae bacterium]MDW8260917.1 prepilin-type N-terminal cleavage/methylation domain-containing protein [Phycisphaerales bacterium]
MRKSRVQIRLHRGFTLVELLVGLTITAVVMAALISFSAAIGTASQSAAEEEQVSAMLNAATSTLTATTRRAVLAGAYHEGSLDNSAAQPAAIVLWRADQNFDGIIQRSELELLGHDPATRKVFRYSPGNLKVDDEISLELFHNPSLIADCKARFNRQPVISRVAGMRLRVHSRPESRPVLEVTLKLRASQRERIRTVTRMLGGPPGSVSGGGK